MQKIPVIAIYNLWRRIKQAGIIFTRGDPSSAGYSARPVRIVSSSQKKDYKLTVRFAEAASGWDERASFWQPFVDDEIKEIVARNRSTLVFTKQTIM